MTDNKKLIEEAREVVQSWDLKGSWNADSPVGMLARLADALEAAEKAHTPTDDEREALAQAIRDSLGVTPETIAAGHQRPGNTDDLARDLIARGFGFRRSEVSETSGEMIAPEDGMTLAELGEAFSEASPHWDGDEAMHAIIYRFIEQYALIDSELYDARESTNFDEGAEILFRYDHEAATLVLHPAAQGEPSSMVPEPSAEATHRGTFGHVWPCPLFYVGNWRHVENGHEPVRDCANAAACADPAPQGEPSDAEEAVEELNKALTHPGPGARREKALHDAAILARRALLRAAGGEGR